MCLGLFNLWASQVAHWQKIPLPMRETQVWPLGQEDPLEQQMTTHSSILAWKIPQTEESDRAQSMGLQRVRQNWQDTSNVYINLYICIYIYIYIYICRYVCIYVWFLTLKLIKYIYSIFGFKLVFFFCIYHLFIGV